MTYTCPVCDFSKLRYDPSEEMHEICPQCGTQFGYSDATLGSKAERHAELRAAWEAAGRPWHSTVIVSEEDWERVEQENRERRRLYHTLDTLCTLADVDYLTLDPVVIAHEVVNYRYKGLATDFDCSALLPEVVEWQRFRKKSNLKLIY